VKSVNDCWRNVSVRFQGLVNTYTHMNLMKMKSEVKLSLKSTEDYITSPVIFCGYKFDFSILREEHKWRLRTGW
jgi:hypothetical protein